MCMASLSLMVLDRDRDFEKKIAFFVAVMFAFSLMAALRVGSRTQLGVAGFSFAISLLFNLSHASLKVKFFLMVSFLVVCGLGYSYLDVNSDLLLYYADRIDDDDASVAQAGGRLERWRVSFEYLIGDGRIMGWEFEKVGYAHNLWLDVARESGIIPFLLLLVFMIFNIKLI